ncbi:RNA polymerase sigma factor SigX [Bacillus sp. THAF10]|uniref:RNA polymerase sigma factor n=1 Tax=Bacillus sp. THAF10 TaxID=2587848 RepID=UPI0012694F9E|nr:RNA polymerase sigma factor [Bacillus sp. THAF10]QFT89685.1 RNA polymerase sigma factor SigX [Bacillus sp. THAF10]
MTWESLYTDYSDKIYRFILLMVGNEEVAEDLTHDTFIRVENALHNYKGNASHYTWLVSIARNVTYDYWRRKKKIRFYSLTKSQEVPSTDVPEELLLKEEAVQELYYAINKLKLNYREIIILRKIQFLSIEETSIVLGWSESKVKSTLQRAIEALRKELEKQRKGVVGDEQEEAK